MQFFPSDELIKSLVKTGVMTAQLSSGSYMKVGGQAYKLLTNLSLDMSTVGFGGLDFGAPAIQTQYYVYVVLNGSNLGLVASLNAYQPTGFTSYKLVGKVEFDATLDLAVVNADFINEVQESQIETIQLTLSQATTNISALQTQIASQSSAASALTGRVTTAEQDIVFIESAIDTLSGRAGTLEADVAAAEVTIGTHTTQIGTLQTQMTAAQSSITSLGSQDTIHSTNISNLQSTVLNHTPRIASLEGKFDLGIGHTHNGLDAPPVKAIDLDSETGTPNQVLAINGAGDVVWQTISFPTPKVNCIDLSWVEGTVNSPTKQTQMVGSALAYFYFAMGAGGNGQKLYTSFKVPESYIAGKKITFGFLDHTATADSASTYQFACTSYLIKPGMLAGSSALSHLATGSIITVGTTPDALHTNKFDLTDASGQIAAQAVAPGDLIHVMIEKLDTGVTEDANATSVLHNGVEVVFNV